MDLLADNVLQFGKSYNINLLISNLGQWWQWKGLQISRNSRQKMFPKRLIGNFAGQEHAACQSAGDHESSGVGANPRRIVFSVIVIGTTNWTR